MLCQICVCNPAFALNPEEFWLGEIGWAAELQGRINRHAVRKALEWGSGIQLQASETAKAVRYSPKSSPLCRLKIRKVNTLCCYLYLNLFRIYFPHCYYNNLPFFFSLQSFYPIFNSPRWTSLPIFPVRHPPAHSPLKSSTINQPAISVRSPPAPFSMPILPFPFPFSKFHLLSTSTSLPLSTATPQCSNRLCRRWKYREKC